MKILFVSLGCDKNLVDSEVMLGLLGRAGYQFTDDESEADIIVVNTCCFIGDAKEESINTLLEMAKQKETGRCKVLIAAGCLAQRYKREVLEEIPEVDGILGTASCDKITEVVEQTLKGKKSEEFESLDRQRLEMQERVVTTGGHYAYLKIAEGCDKHCTYCVIPSVRGRYRSVPLDELIKEAEQLSEGGVRELILVAQETTLYGVDLYGKKMLPELLKKLAGISGIHWIRLLYCYPEEITDELIEVVKKEEKICHYMDIPIQHASDRILKRMGRKTDRQEITKRICRLREEIPDIAIRTTMITGFPGETAQDMDELLDFVDEMEFDRLGVFPYSQEEDTPAAVMDGQVSEEEKNERRDQVMKLQQEIAFAHGEDMVGRVLEAFIEGKVADESAYVGRTYMDAPGVDGYIFVNTDLELVSGMFVRVKVTGAVDYDLIGELIDEDEFTE
ncbi:30S ribosomal protein S12 methylthiotransferase RimO [Lacrimispora sp. NSJ-141]|uniref:Ribosomal protein uS12 methylthiotransferase RimO n=1 Tax=Lientehia hominis TaxID=2897778 RepID=A0AAP2RI83_9FIRM|nr:30S ribosomal protein S12 methylthiotransferase RimO [Lientehia hominis]MCD2492692.1 30S ribosomal protein S12 methylthiotransferase RimO [Lientehia hominis]